MSSATEEREWEGIPFVAKAVQKMEIKFVFGIVGIPVTPLAVQFQKEGLEFYGMRNEQAASYATSAVGYLTQTPAICLTVAGPGMVHALPGVLNAQVNGWPMILLSASCERSEKDRGGFQESKQLEAALPYVKHAIRIEDLKKFPYHLEKAVRISKYGKPGPVYIEIPGDVLKSKVSFKDSSFPSSVPPPPKFICEDSKIIEAASLIQQSKKPLVIVGSNAAYWRAEKGVNHFVDAFQLPFLPSPMGKGVIRDDHQLSVAAARTLALQEADVIVLIGQTLNWMYHFGDSPRLSENVKYIQIETSGEELHTDRNVIPLLGDIQLILEKLSSQLESNKFVFAKDSPWLTSLQSKKNANIKTLEQQQKSSEFPLTYHRVLGDIKKFLPENAVVVNEGANTLDFGRTIIPNFLPRRRLDSGVLGTMGVGLGYAIAGAVVFNSNSSEKVKVVAIEGDSAFGFSGMEVEVACRFNLPILFIVLNNNGIYKGTSVLPQNEAIPPTVFVPDAHYEKIIEAFGGKGYFVTRAEELEGTLKEAFNSPVPALVNIMINPDGPIPRNVQQDQKKT